jgi:protein O-GlcNAc transferase
MASFHHLLTILLAAAVLIREALSFASAESSTIKSLLQQAKRLIVETRDSNAAFSVLSQVYQKNPNAAGLSALIESCLRLKIEIDNDDHDRFGLASLLVDQERYEEATLELESIIDSDNHSALFVERASSVLYRTKAATCDWESRDDDRLGAFMRLNERASSNNYRDVPAVHPFEALKWPCISLAQATQIAQLYARRAILSQGLKYDMLTRVQRSTVTLSSSSHLQVSSRKIRLAYLSPDFTSNHPLAFLMQHVFQHHDRCAFEVHAFSLCKPQDCPEVQAIRDGCDVFTVLPTGQSAKELAAQIQDSGVDILIDLCGYTGTSLVAEIMAHRPALLLQVGYMGFPASSGAPYMDYMICDATVVPPSLRHHYTEGLIVMPHSYFVNSHATACIPPYTSTKKMERSLYGLPKDAFVFCCHSRPDKLDPDIFDIWVNGIRELRDKHQIPAVLWLLRSCPTMEHNLRRRVGELLPEEALVFCNVAPRPEHFARLALADVFLDTPAYNAHTVGCDTLYAGVPMISLLSEEKMASRVGASLLRAAGLDELVADSAEDYQKLMRMCVLDKLWFSSVTAKLLSSRNNSPLFDTRAWVQNLDRALLHLVTTNATGGGEDVIVLDD